MDISRFSTLKNQFDNNCFPPNASSSIHTNIEALHNTKRLFVNITTSELLLSENTKVLRDLICTMITEIQVT